MPRNKVLEKAKVSMPSGRNAFDLSQVRSYDALAGYLNVAYCQPVVAGTKGSVSRKCFTRTARVVSPAFHSVTEHFDFFLVPIHSMWRQWENWKLNINDMKDTDLVKWNGSNMTPDLSLPSSAPRMNFNGVLDRVYQLYGVTYSDEDAANFIVKNANDGLRLLDQLRYTEEDAISTSVIGDTSSRVLNLFSLGAYQKVYFEHYRKIDYESNNPYAYNFDWLYDGNVNGQLSPSASRLQDVAVAKELLKMRRVNYRNDYFHNIYPSLNYVSSSPSGISFSLPSNIGQIADTPFVYAQTGAVYPTTNGTASNGVVFSKTFTVQNIRAAFALDKLMRASAYAPKHVKEQWKVQFGVDGVEDFDMRSERIASFQSDVLFQEVTNMAETGLNNLGDLGAKGLGGDDRSKPVNFYAKYDSILIGVHYFMPRARYDAIGYHPFNVKLMRNDFYSKAFENLGLRPFYASYIDARANTSFVVGWTVPNQEYKILPDLNTGMFKEHFYNIEYDAVSQEIVYSRSQSSLSSFVPHNNQVFEGVGVRAADADYFKVAPEDLDNIFVVSIGADHDRNTCQFFGEFRIFVPVVAPMSVHGQPSL